MSAPQDTAQSAKDAHLCGTTTRFVVLDISVVEAPQCNCPLSINLTVGPVTGKEKDTRKLDVREMEREIFTLLTRVKVTEWVLSQGEGKGK